MGLWGRERVGLFDCVLGGLLGEVQEVLAIVEVLAVVEVVVEELVVVEVEKSVGI